MIQPLRRLHRLAFLVLAMVLPVILFVGLRGRHPRANAAPVQMPPFAQQEKLP